MFWKNQNHMLPGCNYGGVYCLICLGYLSYACDTSLMFGIFVLCFGKIKITYYPGATMAECIVLCLGYLSYVWDTSLMFGIFVLCFGKTKPHATRVQLWRSVLSHDWVICLLYGVLVLCMGY